MNSHARCKTEGATSAASSITACKRNQAQQAPVQSRWKRAEGAPPAFKAGSQSGHHNGDSNLVQEAEVAVGVLRHEETHRAYNQQYIPH